MDLSNNWGIYGMARGLGRCLGLRRSRLSLSSSFIENPKNGKNT